MDPTTSKLPCTNDRLFGNLESTTARAVIAARRFQYFFATGSGGNAALDSRHGLSPIELWWVTYDANLARLPLLHPGNHATDAYA